MPFWTCGFAMHRYNLARTSGTPAPRYHYQIVCFCPTYRNCIFSCLVWSGSWNVIIRVRITTGIKRTMRVFFTHSTWQLLDKWRIFCGGHWPTHWDVSLFGRTDDLLEPEHAVINGAVDVFLTERFWCWPKHGHLSSTCFNLYTGERNIASLLARLF